MGTKIKVKLILSLWFKGASMNTIASTNHMSKHSVSAVCRLAKEKGLDESILATKTEDQLYDELFPQKWSSEKVYSLPDYDYVHKELGKTGVTLRLLWEEYIDECKHKDDGSIHVSYAKYCRDYERFRGRRGFANHIEHKPGERMEVDWSGPAMSYYDESLVKHKAYLFVSDLVSSRMAYVEPCRDMKEPAWLMCHVNMWSYFGGVSRYVVCDNLKTGVASHPKEGEIILTREYEALADHYGVAILPAGVKRPRQKNSVENTVGTIATAIIARLRNNAFYSFEALKKAVARELEEFNSLPFEKRAGSRRLDFDENEQSFLRPLPKTPFEIGFWCYGRTVRENCHVNVEKNWYSCPCQYLGQEVDVRVTPCTVSIYASSLMVKEHFRFAPGMAHKYRTDPADMPKEGAFLPWDASRYHSWASKIGPATSQVIERILGSYPIIEQGYNAAKAVLHLSGTYGNDRLERSSEMALKKLESPRYIHLKSILASGQDKEYVDRKKEDASSICGILRGADYYKQVGEKQNADK
jgi:transposase